MNVAVIGASHKPEKFSYQAMRLLEQHGHRVFPVHVALKEIEGKRVYASVKEIAEAIDTVTLYVNESVSSKLAQDILGIKPKRIIFNPGAENPQLAAMAKRQGIEALEDCTLVMLRTGNF